jgi:thioesterase domain-containing protein
MKVNIEQLRNNISQKLFGDALNKVNPFPELLLLNDVNNNHRAVFWIHSVGGVQPYFTLAKHINRPFYGIESRGFRTNRSPLYGIHAMAAYYVHILKSIQPWGPYELGGYSLGGLIAYEMTRQLQELGDQVTSIVMLDTLDSNALKNAQNISYKSRLLQGANFILASKILHDTEKLKKSLIHADEVNWEKSNEKIMGLLCKLAKEKGATQSEEILQTLIIKNAQIQIAYEYERYQIAPLEKPEDVTCYYFRNKSGLFFGDLKPYYAIPSEKTGVDHLVYWDLWQKNFPNFEIMHVESTNHMAFFNEEKVYKPIIEFCEHLYHGMEKEILQAFKQKLK